MVSPMKLVACALLLVLLSVDRAAAADDAVVVIVPPLRAAIPSDKPKITKKVRVKVSNANENTAQTLSLSASSTDCAPRAIIRQPDFEPGTETIESTVTLPPRRSRQAIVSIDVTTAFTTLNRRTPTRCTIVFTASSATPSNVDPTPDNNVATLELNAFDLSDPEQRPSGEAILESYRAAHPGKIEIFADNAGKSDTVRVVVSNGAPQDSSDLLTVTASDGDCPVGTVGSVDFDDELPGAQNTAAVAGQHSVRGKLELTVNAADFLSPNRQSLGRCTALLTVSGVNGDTDGSNDATRLPINVFDRNDL